MLQRRDGSNCFAWLQNSALLVIERKSCFEIDAGHAG
jgi:hypothetical protein